MLPLIFLFEQLHTHLSPASLAQLHTEFRKLLNYVPYRFLRPFFEQEVRGVPDQYINRRIIELANQSTRVPYRFLDNEIELNDDWAIYLQQHQAILQGFIQWHLFKFLQKHNPNVVGLSEKLEKPGVRVLSRANKFWKEYLKSNPYLPCIYSTQIITSDNFSLDHFLPWSFVAHDQLWNIIPTPKSVNSAKSDWLPSVDLYLDQYATLQYNAF
ncbi:HNH endonuclease domain-containing protein [Telluribacter humicola]